ncbi:La-related protein 7 [Araneus ventricosus]|uniref:La-related protein 7 n=1 Tax=Araneus ventricosus TaxID=182803 RepID=A0A4Y2RF82_ARAVE|nr:La-related protein 7 [Araneus ventricosus]GBN74096.1 La-related protein 7 [Araneus ventricosus]
MEFYFSDSNLARDSYLQDLLSKNPEGYVDLEVFKTFNKIKEVTDDVNAIVAALSKSTILQINEEKTKVRRITPMGKPKDFDACTLYVEKLPPHADHKWIKDVFERFGRVDYINIPRYKVSNKMKGFAFIEFSDPESVKKACEFYKRSSGKENIESDDQCSESKSDKMQKTETCSEKDRKARKRKMSSDADEPPHKKKDDTSEKISSSKGHGKIEQTSDNDVEKKQAPSDRKRKLDSGDYNGKPHKKLKESDSEHPTVTSEAEGTEIEKHQPSVVENQSGLETADSGNEAVKIKKKRKHKKKGHHHSEKPVLRVMSKHEWKVYRNKYLNLQRSTMSYLKKQIMMETQELKEQEPVDEKLENETSNKGLHFQPGVIIKIILKDSITDPSDIKSYASFHVEVFESDFHLLSDASIWPEGCLVTEFFGRLKEDQIYPDNTNLPSEPGFTNTHAMNNN